MLESKQHFKWTLCINIHNLPQWSKFLYLQILPLSSIGAHFESNVWRHGRTVPWNKPAITLVTQIASHPQYSASTGIKSVTKPHANCASEKSLWAPQFCATMLPIICVHTYPQKKELWIISLVAAVHGNSFNEKDQNCR